MNIYRSDITLDEVKIYTKEDNQLALSQNPGTDAGSIYYVIAQNLIFSTESGYITIAPNIDIIVDPSFLP